MSAITEEHRQRLQEFRQQKSIQRLWELRRRLLILLVLVGVAASIYTWA